jgi:hypothetical protein
LPAFSAETVAEALDFTFTYKVGKKVIPGASGVIAEPNDQQIAAFLKGIKRITREAKAKLPDDAPASTPAELMDAAEDLDPEAVVSLMHDMAETYSALCSGFPSTEEILILPMRRRQGFYVWLQTEVMSPEAGPGAGRAQVTQLPRAAAG